MLSLYPNICKIMISIIVKMHQNAITKTVAGSSNGLYFEFIIMQIPSITNTIELT